MAKIKISDLYHSELISGVLLMISFALAVGVANLDALEKLYKSFVFCPITFGSGAFIYTGPLIQVVNDGLMTLFFLLIGLELKFHLVRGEFKDKHTLVLPSIAAIGGIAVPALIYVWFTHHNPQLLRGWAIPIATDTAFMLGILSFFGSFITPRLRAFIIGFSLIDDSIALVILALFYSKTPEMMPIMICIALISILFAMNKLKIMTSFYYIFTGFFLWFAMVESGIHGTLCGVIVALAIPVDDQGQTNPSFHSLENFLQPIVYFLILPLFSFINSGVSFDFFSFQIFKNDLALGILLGLFLGKQMGIFLFSYTFTKLKVCALPETMCWKKFYGISVLSGIGFTLSLFIGDMTFEASEPHYIMRISVITGSLLSAIVGASVLMIIRSRKKSLPIL